MSPDEFIFRITSTLSKPVSPLGYYCASKPNPIKKERVGPFRIFITNHNSKHYNKISFLMVGKGIKARAQLLFIIDTNRNTYEITTWEKKPLFDDENFMMFSLIFGNKPYTRSVGRNNTIRIDTPCGGFMDIPNNIDDNSFG